MTGSGYAVDPHARPFDRSGMGRRTAPFAASLVLAFALAPVGSPDYGIELPAALALALLTTLAVAVMPWDRMPELAELLPVVGFLGVVALLRHDLGGAASGYAALALVPVVWAALYGSGRLLAATVAATGSTIALPAALIGGSLYPEAEWRRTVFMVVVAAILAVAIQSLVSALRSESVRREQSETTLRELQALEINDDVVQNLAVAKAALELGQRDRGYDAVQQALESAKAIVARLLDSRTEFGPGSLVRERPTSSTARQSHAALPRSDA